MNCQHYEDRLSDYLEAALNAADRELFDRHLQACAACRDLLAGMSEVIQWGRSFPVHAPPPWLADRIVANTPRVIRERWIDTLAAAGRWIIAPRTAMAVFTATLMLAWMGSVVGISPPSAASVVANPALIYYEAGGVVSRIYDQAVRAYYRSALVSEIHCRLEQLKENS